MSGERYELSTWESMTLLGTMGIGRLCVIDQGFPLAVPVNYRIAGGSVGAQTVVIRTAPNTLIGRYEGLASLEVDDIHLDAGTAWSVMVRGALRRVVGTHDLPDPCPVLPEGRVQWMTMSIGAVSGRRFRLDPDGERFAVEWQMVAG
jgi:hypothetical protein